MFKKAYSATLFLLFLVFPLSETLALQDSNRSCFYENFGVFQWGPYTSHIFVGEVVWAEEEPENYLGCGVFTSIRGVKYQIIESLMGDLSIGSYVKINHTWCWGGFDSEKDIFKLKARLLVSADFCDADSCGFRGLGFGRGQPLNDENFKKVESFKQCMRKNQK